MAISEKDLLQILDWLEKSAWDDLRLETPEFKLTVSKSGRPLPASGTAPSAPRGAAVANPSPASAAPARPAEAPPARFAEPADPRWVAVKSPTLGHFYVAPKPGAPPFVTVGQKVEESDTVAIVEVMKLMNHVPAGARGTIARICAANGDLVEEDEILVFIDPAVDG